MELNNTLVYCIRIIFMIILLQTAYCLLPTDCSAQTWNEWFKQKKTQRSYHAKQIALMKLYLEYVKKGVTVVRKGLRTVENVKNGDFNLHRDFFSSLEHVNPHIANSVKVADIIAFQVFIMRELGEVNRYCSGNKNFSAEEVRYVADVYANMLVLCDANLSELLIIIQSEKTKMTDDERLKRIDVIHADMLDKHTFAQSFEHDVKFLAHQRQREQHAIEWLRQTNY